VTAPAEAKIDDVADTALWIAAYRAKESARKDALFRDPLAARLAGEKGAVIAERMTGAAQFAWMTVVRTVVVDELVEEAIARGVRTVVNLGAGLDTRPYRMTLPEALRWIEVDSPRIVARKDELLAGERVRCALSRIAADLADARARRELFARLGDVDDDVLVLTEGVLGYLANDEVAALADDLRARPAFKTWIVDYSARFLNRAVRARVGRRELKNAPLRFQPVDSERFFRAHGWRVVERRDLPIAGERLGRPAADPVVVLAGARRPAPTGQGGDPPDDGLRAARARLTALARWARMVTIRTTVRITYPGATPARRPTTAAGPVERSGPARRSPPSRGD